MAAPYPHVDASDDSEQGRSLGRSAHWFSTRGRRERGPGHGGPCGLLVNKALAFRASLTYSNIDADPPDHGCRDAGLCTGGSQHLERGRAGGAGRSSCPQSRGWRHRSGNRRGEKLRWGKAGVGKRGGARVIYFYDRPDCPLYLLLAYAKAQASDLSADEKTAVAAFAATIKATVA